MELLSPLGTITRSQWWLRQVIVVVIGMLLTYMNYTISNPLISSIILIAIAVNAYVAIVNHLKRLRDGGYNPWSIFVGLIPLVGGLMLLVMCGFVGSHNRLN